MLRGLGCKKHLVLLFSSLFFPLLFGCPLPNGKDDNNTAGNKDDNNTAGNTAECVVNVSNGEELKNALMNAKPGYSILLDPGYYTTEMQQEVIPDGLGGTIERKWFFRTTVNGTAEKPIKLRSKDPQNRAILKGNGWTEEGYGLYLCGSNWSVEDIDVTEAAKGIIIDHSENISILGVKIYSIGQEGLHVRDGSHHILIENSHLRDIGLKNDGYGEGVYIGSDKSVWKEGDGVLLGDKGLLYSRDVHHIFVRSCTIGPNITAEPFDLKEGSWAIFIEDCDIYGSGVSGVNYADSHIDVKGTKTVIRRNKFFQESNIKILRGIHVIPRISANVPPELTAHTIYVHDNVFHLEGSVYIGQANTGSVNVFMWNNEKIPPGGNVYGPRITQDPPLSISQTAMKYLDRRVRKNSFSVMDQEAVDQSAFTLVGLLCQTA